MADITGIILGNIGSGKTTFLNTLDKRKTGSSLLPLLNMPGELTVHYESENVLDIVKNKFYPALDKKDPDLLFVSEIDILKARLEQTREIMRQGGIVFMERSLFEDRFVFTESLYKNKLLKPYHYEVYKKMFDSEIHSIVPPDIIIYLYTRPEISYQRMKNRKMAYESNVGLDYHEALYNLYERTVNEELPKIIKDYKDVLLIIDANKDCSSEALEKFHNHIEYRAKRLLERRGFSIK